MSGPVICYLERAGGGSVLRRVRLVAHGASGAVDRTWNAPPLESGREDSAESQAVSATRAAARWVADGLSQLGVKRLSRLCIDPDGSLCTWLSAASPDPDVITATLMQPEGDDTGGGGAARLLALGAGSSQGFSPSEASVQALATLDQPGAGAGIRLPRRKADAGDIDSKRERYAVMAVPDAPVRVFLDELDSRGVEVEQTISLWHAMAEAWDPSADDAVSGESERVVASVSPASAIILIDPIGRLIWAWSQSGQLVAGGTMRLRTVHRRIRDEQADDPSLARRVGGANAESTTEEVIEFTGDEAGRLVMDWLSWSAQLGHCPQRVACIGPAPTRDAAVAPPDPAMIGQALGSAWPGATVGVAVHADPVGATLQRMVGIAAAPAPEREDAATGGDDPRAALIGLSARPGRADRSMYTWMAFGVAAGAILVGALGWQLHHAGGSAQEAIAKANLDRKEALESLEPDIPGITLYTPNDARAAIEGKIEELRKQAGTLKASKPLLAEASRIFAAISRAAENHDGIRIGRIELNPVAGVVDLFVPSGETGPEILEDLLRNPDTVMVWQGNAPSVGIDGQRKYIITGFPKPDAGKAEGGGR